MMSSRKPKLKEVKNENEEEIIIPKDKRKRDLIIILKENGFAIFKYFKNTAEEYEVDNHTYFPTPHGSYRAENRQNLCVYIEGCPFAIAHKYLEFETKKIDVILPNGEKEKKDISVLKGVKYDSKMANNILTRAISTRMKNRKSNTLAGFGAILMIVVVILEIINLFV